MSHPSSHDTSIGGASHGSYTSYIIGFLLCVVLTAIPFGVVMMSDLSKIAMVWVIVLAAVAQIYIQLYFFLHMDTSSEQRWNVIAFIFSVVIMFVVVAGSIWIMAELNYFMM